MAKKTTDYAINEERPYGILIAGHYTETVGVFHSPAALDPRIDDVVGYLRESYRERAFKPKKCPAIKEGVPRSSLEHLVFLRYQKV